MYRYSTEDIFDEQIDCILRFLFEYQSAEQKQQRYIPVYNLFMQLDLAANYYLFSLIEERLPRRAKLFFVAEDYQGKKDIIIEVMQYWLGQRKQEK
ncbi:hypothetical protein HXZ95_12700 [Acinetobacter pseudolwoffii]|uniref:hypothetical protein n=1 Tax=Acinetobacter pseudolwoffii TaxID=2053287 RepID=UPI0025754008|nr:hypothetical protein [Acinetobacter pseudolwoffii]MDM1345081.1 hypothetical protein [Acinetobacter pseudolwoffii]